MTLDSLLQTTLDRCVKGLPPPAAPMRLGEVGTRGWNLLKGDLPRPVAVIKGRGPGRKRARALGTLGGGALRVRVAVIKRAALDHNSRWMRQFLELTDAKIAPHGKTTMAPQLFAKQLADGAWGITGASVGGG